MADNKDVEEGPEETVVDKYNLGASDLAKMSDFNDDKEDLQNNNAAVNNIDHLKSDSDKIISLRAEDVKLLTDEFELTRGRAEQFLIKHRGDIKSTIRELVDFD